MSHSAWSDLHDLALVYLALLYSTASPARSPEERAIEARLRLGEQYPEASEGRLQQVFHEALLTYTGVTGAPMLDVAVASLSESLPRAERSAVLGDLVGLASSDGERTMPPSGRSFIQHLAARWNVERTPGRFD